MSTPRKTAGPRKAAVKPATPRRKAAPEPRDLLLDAGMQLLSRGTPVAKISARSVALEAGLKPAQFSKLFPELADYLAGILRRLSEEVRAETLAIIGRKKPGRDLIRLGITAYLDAVLHRPALPEITLLMRSHPACQQVTRERMSSMVMLATLQLKMAGVPNSDGLGRLGMAMLFEIAHAEFEARRALPDYRQTLDAYFVSERAA